MRKLLLFAVLTIVLVACGPVGSDPVATGTDPTSTAEEDTAPEPTTAPTATPEPFKTELVLCTASPVPTALYGTANPAATVMRHLVSPPAAVYGEDYLAEPGILAALPSVEDGTLIENEDGTITVRLQYREGLTWSDGTPFTLDDAALGLRVPGSLFEPAFPVQQVEFDGDTLVVTAGPEAEYPFVPTQPPLPSHILTSEEVNVLVEKQAADLPLDVTLGPYVQTGTSDDGSRLEFALNDAYYGGPARIAAVHVRFLEGSNQAFAELQNGNCDVILDGSLGRFQTSLLDIGDVAIAIWPGQAYERVVFNTFVAPEQDRIPYFADERVRQAMLHAIGLRRINSLLTGGFGETLDSWLPPSHWAETPVLDYDNDPERAAALLEEAGWVDSDGDGVRDYQGPGGAYACQRGEWAIEPGTPLRPEITIPLGDDLRTNMAELIQGDLRNIGVDLQIMRVEPEFLFSNAGPIAQRSFDAVLFSELIRPDPGGIEQWVGADVFLHPTELNLVHRWQLEDRWLTSDQLVERVAPDATPSFFNDFVGQNYGGWCQDEANILIVQATLADTVEERTELYAQHQQIYAEQVPTMPLFAQPRIAAHATYVCGVAPGPVDPMTWNITEWFFDDEAPCGP